MNPEYILLPLALLCLWTPAVLVSSAEVREKLTQQVRRHDDGFVSLTRNWVNWLDLIRAAAGTWMLQRVITTFSVGQDDIKTTIIVVQIAILLIGMLIQSVWFSQRLMAIGPVFYLVGMTCIVSGPKVAGFGLLLGYTCALMLRRLSFGFAFVPVSLLLFSKLFGGFGLLTIFNAGAFVLPLLLAFALGQRVAYARRPVKSRGLGYVYAGTHLQDRDEPTNEDLIPEKEDVPARNFTTSATKPAATGRRAPASVIKRFPTQNQPHPITSPSSAQSATR